MKVLISGSTGLVGAALNANLRDNEVFKLVRTRADLLSHEIAWEPEHRVINPPLLEGFDAVVHLAGENIMGKWTENKKQRIRDSRVQGTQVLCKTLAQLTRPPSVLVCASAVGYYGNRGDEILTEQSPKGDGFLASVCEEWEDATRIAAEKGIRVVNLRLGMVLSSRGGALQRMLPIFKLCLGGKVGSGEQYISWITIDDLLSLIKYAIDNPNLAGPVNAVSPHPVTNVEFTKILGKVLHRPTIFPLPSWIVNLVFGEMGQEILLSSTRAFPKKLEDKGFQFKYPTIETALNGVVVSIF